MIALSPADARCQLTFRALMAALAYPGQPQRLPVRGTGTFEAIAEALVDLETGAYSPDAHLARQLALLGARNPGPAAALYQFYPDLNDASLQRLESAPTGSYLYPDQSATLILGGVIGAGLPLQLTGPGIADQHRLRIAGLPRAFWGLREAALQYPLGWDVFIVGHDQVIGLPRTTRVTLEEGSHETENG